MGQIFSSFSLMFDDICVIISGSKSIFILYLNYCMSVWQDYGLRKFGVWPDCFARADMGLLKVPLKDPGIMQFCSVNS